MSEAWELAHEAAAAAGVELRALPAVEDADLITAVLVATWGEEQAVPREMLRALSESGNVPYGAFARDDLVGYVLGWAGVDRDEGLHVHSHMLAALPDRRHRGIGYALKLAQRAQALDQGIEVVRWTFDPLVARNAYFNLRKLGVVADRFERAFYGEMTDAVNRGDRSDRLVVRWDLRKPPGGPEVTDTAPGLVALSDDGPRYDPPPGPMNRALLPIPSEYHALRAADPAAASRWRDVVAEGLESSLAAGLLVTGFRPAGPAAYLLTREAAP
jgi:predicted GNAT superfamily acetyltransferase